MPRLKRVKTVISGPAVMVTGYTYSGKGKDVLLGSIVCDLADLKAELLKPDNQRVLGISLLKSR
jgi:hypothetical protein